MRLRIEKAIYGGSGLARIGEGPLAGKTVFVPLTLPSETVDAHAVEDKRSFVNAEADTIVDPSPQRVIPSCPYFGSCGGCSYQHAEYRHQLEIKKAILIEAFERARLASLPDIRVLSGHPWNYRNRIRMHLQPSPFALVYRERRSNRLLSVDKCPIAAPLLEKAISAVTESGAALQLASFCDEIEFFSADETSLLISFLGGKSNRLAQTTLPKISLALKESLPQMQGTARFLTQGKQSPSAVQSWGERSLVYKAAGTRYRVSLGSFFQVNRFLVDSLVELVTTNRKGRLAWDFYAGVGLFAKALARNFERVIAVESSPPSSEDLRHNLQDSSHRVVQASSLDFLQRQKRSAMPPDLVVVDPPRAGLGRAMTESLSQIGPAEIVYVSCDPATLSRDLAALVNSGYDLRTITMVDMFPQTFHLESVSVLTRR